MNCTSMVLEHRLPNNLNVSFAYVEGEAMMMAIKNIACSSGQPVLQQVWNQVMFFVRWMSM